MAPIITCHQLIQSFLFPYFMIKLSFPFPLSPLPPSLSSTKVWTISVKRGKYITPPPLGVLALLADIWFCVRIWEHKIVNIRMLLSKLSLG